MKTSTSLFLVLCLMAALLTACGDKQSVNGVAATTTADITTNENVTTKTDEDAATTTASLDAATTATEGTVTTTTAATTTTTTTRATTTTTKPIISAVNPQNYKDNHYYVGALQPDGTGLVRPRILFDGEYAVIMHYMYSATKEEPEQQPFEYQGKTYYGQGEGMSPYPFELTATEILIKKTDDQSTVMKLILQSDGNMQITYSTDTFFPVGLILAPTPQ